MVGKRVIRAAPLAACLLAAACGSGLRDTLVAAMGDYHAANSRVLASGSPIASGSGIDSKSAIVFEFDSGMGEGSVVLGGDLAREASSSWSSRQEPDDTLSLSPASGSWTAGSNRGLTLSFKAGGAAALAISLSLGILEGVVYASDAAGSDSWPGTADRPKKTVKAAIEAAAAYYGKGRAAGEVRVAGGTYTSRFSLGTQPVLVPGISLLGSYSPSDWSQRDSAAWPSILVDGSVGELSETGRALDCGGGAGRDTLVEGFTVRGGGNAETLAGCGVYCGGSGPTLRDLKVTGGASALSAGIVVKSGTPLVTDCEINGGNGSDSIGVFAKNCGSGCVIEGNDIAGGSGNVSCAGVECYGETEGLSAPVVRGNRIVGSSSSTNIAVGVWNMCSDTLVEANEIRAGSFLNAGQGINDEPGSNTVIRNNLIAGGEGYAGDSSAVATGIYAGGKTSTIQNNSICGGWTYSAYQNCITTGIILGPTIDAGATDIENNIIFTLDGNSRTGVLQMGESRPPATLAKNLFYGCPFSLYTISSAVPAYVTSAAAFSAYSWASGNLEGDPLFVAMTGLSGGVSGSDWHLRATSPAKGAAAVLSGFSTDFEGTARGTSWSVGAYQ